jgi:hypothetical protein
MADAAAAQPAASSAIERKNVFMKCSFVVG